MSLMFWKKTDDDTRQEPKQGTTMTEMDNPTAPEARAPTDETAPAAPAGQETAVPEPAEEISHVNRIQLENRVIEAVSGVFDPEIPVNIYELGLIYDIEVTPEADVQIKMTLTSPACPVAESLPGDVENVVSAIEGIRAVNVELVWDPPWTPDRMSEGAKLELGFM